MSLLSAKKPFRIPSYILCRCWKSVFIIAGMIVMDGMTDNTICGITSGIAGILWASQLGTAVSTAGEGSEMTPIAAVVIGGVSLSGGKGKIWGAFIGTALLSVFTNLMALMTVDAYYQKMLNGVVLILAVFIDILRSSKKTKI